MYLLLGFLSGRCEERFPCMETRALTNPSADNKNVFVEPFLFITIIDRVITDTQPETAQLTDPARTRFLKQQFLVRPGIAYP